MLSQAERTATIQALTPVECLTFDSEVVKSVLAASRERLTRTWMQLCAVAFWNELGALQDTVIENSLDADTNQEPMW